MGGPPAGEGLKRCWGWPLCSLAFLSLLAWLFLGPLWGQPGLPNSADGLLHLHRAAGMARAWRAGVLWPRWLPEVYQGLGAPVYHYYSPLFYLLLAPLHLLSLPLDLAAKVVLTGLFLVSGWAVHAWLKRLLSPAAGWAGAALYLAGPHLFREYYFQGDYPQLIALFWLPVVFWAFTCLYLEGRGRSWFLAPLSLALLVLAHNITAMLGAAFLGLYWMALPLWRRSWAGWRRGVLAGLLGVGLSAFFWVPALGDAGLVRVENLQRGFFHYSQYFLSLADLVAPPPLLDSRALNPPFPHHLGWAAWLALAGGVLTVVTSSLRRSPWTSPQVWAAVGLVLAALPLSLTLAWTAPVWERLPGLAFVQFPGRLLGLATLGAALAGGAAIAACGHRPWAALSLLLLAIGFASSPFLFARQPFLPIAGLTGADTQAYERESRIWGLASGNDFLPQWAAPPEPFAGEKAEAAFLPPDADWTWETPHRAVLRATKGTSLSAGLLVLPVHYFPAWKARVDGASGIPVLPGPRGLAELDLPQGASQVSLEWQGTAWQHWGEGVATAAGVLWLAIVALAGRCRTHQETAGRTAPAAAPLEAGTEGPGTPLQGTLLPLGLLLTLILAREAIAAGGHDKVWREALAEALCKPSHPLQVTLGGGDQPEVVLLGWDPLTSLSPRPGGEVRVRLYWEARVPVPEALHSFLHLYTPALQQSWAVAQNQNPGSIPTDVWPPGFYVVDDLKVTLPLDLPPASYALVAGLVREDGERLTVPGEEEGLVSLGQVDVQPLQAGPHQPLRPSVPTPALFGPNLLLQGYDLLPDPAGPTLRLYWEVLPSQVPSRDLHTFVHLVDGTGKMVAQYDGPPLAGLSPSSQWPSGSLLLDRRPLPLPADLPGGRYTILVGLYDPVTLERAPVQPRKGAEGRILAADRALAIPLTLPPP
ncbi:MAG: 6-pyruvoyl-tetrahydropterin synthase-related protein [Anaerolineae bacterium]